MLAMEEASIAGRLSPLLRSGHALTAVEAEQVVALVRSSHGPQRAIERARSLASDARHELETIGRGEAVQTPAALTDYVVFPKVLPPLVGPGVRGRAVGVGSRHPGLVPV